MSMHGILARRNHVFTQLAQEFAVLSPSVDVSGDFLHGKFLQTPHGRLVDMTGMDCLALGSLPEVKTSLIESIKAYDVACPASGVVTLMGECVRAEECLARWLFPTAPAPGAILFHLGFDANESFLYGLGTGLQTGVLSPFKRELVSLGDSTVPTVFLQDRYLHYSGARGISHAVADSRGRCFRYVYRDPSHLETLLRTTVLKRHGHDALRVIATDSVLSTTGEVYDMEALLQIAERYDALLYIDEAHAGGSYGECGRGVASMAPSFSSHQDRVIIMMTIIKAMCHVGAFVAFPHGDWKRMFEWTSPHRVFSATPSPFLSAEIVKRIALIEGSVGKERRAMLGEVIRYMRERLQRAGFDVLGSHHLCSLWVRPDKASALRQFLVERGFLTAIFEPPAVPRGTALLRFGLRADLAPEEVHAFVRACCDARERLSFIPSAVRA